MSDDLNKSVERRLRPDEELYWAARPLASRHFFPSFRTIMHFAMWMLWTVLTVTSLSSASVAIPNNPAAQAAVSGIHSMLTTLNVAFLALGLWHLSAPFRRYWAASKMIYAITSERALILKDGRTTPLKSFNRPRPADIEIVERGYDTGDILFTRQRRGLIDLIFRGYKIPGFLGVLGVARVADQLDRIRTDHIF